MENSDQLAKRFKEVLLNGTWIANTNYKDQLSKVSWQQASKKMGTLHTIVALTYHVKYYLAGISNVFEGGALEIRDKYSFEYTQIESKEDWDKFLNELWTNAEKFANHVGRMSDEKLAQTFVDEKYGTYRRNIEGVIEHSYYHLGQISLIRKMIRESEDA